MTNASKTLPPRLWFHLATLTLFVLACFVPGGVWSQCPGTPVTTQSLSVYVYSTPSVHVDPDPIADFIGTGCTTAKFGSNPPDNCGYQNTPGLAILTASWMNAAFNVISNGCTFNCQGGGTCRLRGDDGLPVELLDFSVGKESEGATTSRSARPARESVPSKSRGPRGGAASKGEPQP